MKAAGLSVAIALLPACGGGDDSVSVTTTAPSAGLPNPASAFCEEKGGTVEIVIEDQGEVGYCVLPDGTRIEEWEYYRRNAPTP
jgi:hypothetical protein